MKRKVDWDEEEESDYKDTNASELVSRQKASDLLHSMAASKDILFWTPRGQLLRNQRIIPAVANISELVKFVLLLHNDDIVQPRAIKTFIDGLAELGINRRLIQNDRILAELLEKEQAWCDKDSEARGDKEMVYESSDIEDGKETASEYSEHQERILLKGKGPCYYCNGENVYERAVVKCPRCFWQDGYKICPICALKTPVDRKR